MADEIIITPGDLYTAGEQILSVQSQLDSIHSTLSAGVNQYGAETWGDDSFGDGFAKDKNADNPGYISTRTNLLNGTSNISTAINEFGTGMTTAATDASTVEDNSASSF